MIRTLVVDDDFRVARLHVEYVDKLAGFEAVGSALTGAAAIEQVQQLRPDLVLLDVYLPDRSGLEVAKAIRTLPEPQPDLFFVTAARDVQTVRIAIRGGALHYLVKPFTFATFRDKLAQYRDWRAQLPVTAQADQATVDRLLGALRPVPPDPPKGVAGPTLELVVTALRDLDGAASASEIAAESGVSRATARRYLEHLVETGQVERRMRYGTTGRPEHRFRLVADA
ncbi:response regulator [Egicoccus sp. AB-alg2]|uniref:response regulator n=1 Tax=Egicoccus sp. AB-alg2 TaxID=3242693 RepID=UPI00359DA83E